MREETSRLAQSIFVAALASVLGTLVMFLSLTWAPTEVRALPVRWLGKAMQCAAPEGAVLTLFVTASGVRSSACSSMSEEGLVEPLCEVEPAVDLEQSLWEQRQRDPLARTIRVAATDDVAYDRLVEVIDACLGADFDDVRVAAASQSSAAASAVP
jgi:hypothetical protein